MASCSLTSRDSSVLGALFDPEASLRNGTRIDPNLSTPSSDLDIESHNLERKALLLINDETPRREDVNAAIQILSDVITKNPTYSSAYNNRAQAQRLLFSFEQLLDQPQVVEDILSDLNKAISLASPRNQIDVVSTKQANVLASAHTHRGFMFWQISRPTVPSEKLTSIQAFSNLKRDQFEEFASRDFAEGGRFGNKTAQQFSVKTNPYAKLCGSIVKEALQKEISDHYGHPPPPKQWE